MRNKATMEEIRKHAETQRDKDPVYWGELLRTMDSGFKRPDDKKYRQWLRTLRTLNDRFDEELAWAITDDHVGKTKNRCTECYPVIFGAVAPVRISTPRLPEAVAEGHLLLGFVTIEDSGTHPDDPDGYEPAQLVDEAFVLPCWNGEEVEPMLRGCFLYA